MPWYQQAMKDVVSCEKLRVAANKLLSGDVRMEQSVRGNALSSKTEYIGFGSHTQ